MKIQDLFEAEDIPTVQLNDDIFIHFTYASRAKEIVESGKLLVKPPYKQFGIEGTQSVSVKHGGWVPGVQITHLMKDKDKDKEDRIVAIMFSTDTLPKIGYTEEVIWNTDVNLINPKIISASQARQLLSKNKNPLDVFKYSY